MSQSAFRAPLLLLLTAFFAPLLNVPTVLAASELLEKQGRTDELKDSDTGSIGESLLFKNTLEFENKFDAADQETTGAACEASLTLDYSQKETTLDVETFVTNYTCGASRGSYQVTVDYLDGNGDQQTLESIETWEKFDSDDYLGEHRYPLNIESEVQKVKGRLLNNNACWCIVTNP